MVILSISKLNNLQVAGTNINIPKYVRYLNEICDSGCLNLNDKEITNFKGFKNFFKMSTVPKLKIENLPAPFNKPDLVVFQGFYIPQFIKVSKELKKKNIPYTIIPRCSLTKEAQKIKPFKKKIGNFVCFNKMVRDAKFVHFLTENEYIESKKTFYFNEHVIIGNGTELPDKKYNLKNRNEFKVIYIGRYNIFHKGLDILFDSIKLGQEEFRKNNIKFILFGHDSSNGFEYLNKFIENNNLNDLIELNSSIFGKEKENALLDADVFIHTSRLEGQPTSVIEAISYGIPVIVTPGTNMAEKVKNNKLGFITELDAESIKAQILYSYKNKNKFEEIKENEVQYAKENFEWKIIMKDTINKYKRLLEGEIK